MTRVGGVDLPAEVAAAVAIDELVVHCWDLAMAAGLNFAADETNAQRGVRVRAGGRRAKPGREPSAYSARRWRYRTTPSCSTGCSG